MKSMISGAVVASGVALALLSSVVSSSAATLTLDAVLRVDQPGILNANLTTQGTSDWAYWASLVNPVGTTMAPTNDKDNGSTAISGLTAVGGGSLRGTSSGATTVGRYSWTDGSLAGSTTGTNVDIPGGLIFNTQTGSAALNTGFSLTIAGTALTDNYAVLYLGGFGATGKLTLTLAGVTTIVDTNQIFLGSAPKTIVAYQVKFNPNSASDLLTVQYTASAISDATNGHVGIDAVTVGTASVIPEPASALLSGFGGLLLLGYRRRNR